MNKHEHCWKVELVSGGTQAKLNCECGTEIWVCPCGDSRIAIEGPDGKVKFVSIPKGVN